jgi:NAD(P)-dependent dehydrogenase (short-subunit alcohol dehydrogenase family)
MTILLPKQGGCAWITGASTGIGREVALRLARAGWAVAITARRQELLAELAATPDLQGKLIPFAGDVTDAPGMTALVGQIEATCGPIQLAILNAGTYSFESIEKLEAPGFRAIMETNLMGVVHGLVPVLERMRGRKHGHVAIVSSVAGYGGLPGSLAYGASKAALINLAEALAMEARPHGIKVQVINPGFVATPLTAQNKFPMPFLIPVEQAAEAILRGLNSDRFEIAFPRPMVWLLKTLGWLPYRPYFAFVSRFTGRR